MRIPPHFMPLALLMVVLGAALFWSGCWILWSRGAARRFRAWTGPTRTTLGLCAILAGYHLAAYALPDAWFPIKVPFDRWYVAVLVIIVVLTASQGLDRLRGMSQDSNDPPGA